jgi:hypothetical protein
MMIRPSVLLLLVAALFTVAKPTHASVSVALSLDDLARSSTSVARVSPLDGTSRWEGSRIVTYTRVRVDDPIGGSTERGAIVRVRTLGGVVDGVGQSVQGEARLRPGTSSIVFLGARGDHAVVVGRAQGQLSIARAAEGREIVRTVPVGALVVRTARALPSVLDGRSVEDARAEIARAWRSTDAR